MCRARFKALRSEGFGGDLVTYNTLLKACMRARNGAGAEQAHRAMLEAGIRGDEVTYNTLVKALAYAAEDDTRAAAAAAAAPLLTAAGVPGQAASTWDLQKVHAAAKRAASCCAVVGIVRMCNRNPLMRCSCRQCRTTFSCVSCAACSCQYVQCTQPEGDRYSADIWLTTDRRCSRIRSTLSLTRRCGG